MERHDKELLEFDRIIRSLGANCQAIPNRDALCADFVETSDGFARIAPALKEMTDAVAFLHRALDRHSDLPRGETGDLEPFLVILEKEGSVLELEELGEVLAFLRRYHLAAEWLRRILDPGAAPEPSKEHPEGMAHLSGLATRLPLLRDLQRELDHHLDGTGGLREDRIPELRGARKAIQDAQSELRRSASGLMQSHHGVLSGDFATLRDGRMVLPLKSDFKGRIQGLVHQSSASGSTLYVEPFELVERNNATFEAEARYQEEVRKILRRLSNLCAGRIHDLARSWEGFREFDLLLARAFCGRQMDGVPCAGGNDIRLAGARHPLLGSKAVPIDISYPEGIRMLVISGPNTGGKTVALKTLGLLSLMRQAAMELPCHPGSCLPEFGEVLVDIGDEQSISQNLSTFSGHLARIQGILDRGKDSSLVLLDELGSGTDPAEGSALALAVAERLLRTGCRSLVTSHHGAVKAMAYANPGVMNASMEFSDTELRPTYRVIPGIPGQSHALDTARRLGFPPDILTRAEALLEGNRDVLSDMLERLVREEQSQRLLREELLSRERRIESARRDVETRESRLAEGMRELKDAQDREESRFLSETRSRVEKMVMELSSLRKSWDGTPASGTEAPSGPDSSSPVADPLLQARAFLGELSRTVQDRRNAGNTQKATAEPAPSSAEQLEPGMHVRLRMSGMEGELCSRRRDGSWDVIVRGKRLAVRQDQFDLLNAPVPVSTPRRNPSYSVEADLKASWILDVRGMRAVEARDALIRQLDAAGVQGMSGFGIIHGKGEGKLQVAIAELLRSSPLVEKFEFARPEDGGSGKTMVYLFH